MAYELSLWAIYKAYFPIFRMFWNFLEFSFFYPSFVCVHLCVVRMYTLCVPVDVPECT